MYQFIWKDNVTYILPKKTRKVKVGYSLTSVAKTMMMTLAKLACLSIEENLFSLLKMN